MNNHNHLKEHVLERISELANSKTNLPSLEYLDKFFLNYSRSDRLSFLNYDSHQFLFLIIAMHHEKFPDIALEDAWGSGFCFLEAPSKKIIEAFRLVSVMKDIDILDQFYQLLEDEDLSILDFFKKMVTSSLPQALALSSIKEVSDFYPELARFLVQDSELFLQVCGFLRNVDDLSIFEPFLTYLEILDSTFDCLLANNTEYDKHLVQLVDKVEQYFEKSYYNYLDKEKQWKNGRKLVKKTIVDYQQFLQKYTTLFHRKEVVQFEEMAALLADEDLKKEFLTEVFYHNQAEYSSIEEEYQQLKEHSLSRYVELFSQYKYAFTELPLQTQQSIRNIPYEECQSRLDMISQFKLQNLEAIATYLISCDKDKLMQISSFLNSQLLTSELLDDIYLTLRQEDKYEALLTNVNTITQTGIRLDKFHSQLDLLFTDPKVIAKNVKLLQDYGCRITSRKVEDFSMLANEDLLNKLDSFLEVGLENFIVTNPEILNVDQQLANRILICKMINFPFIENGEFVPTVLDPKKFFVSSDQVSSYVDFKPVDLETVDEEKLTDYSLLTYQYDHQLISKKRWERYQQQVIYQK